MKKSILLIVFVILLSFISLLSCTLAGAEASLVGIWSGSISYTMDNGNDADVDITLTINYDDTGTFLSNIKYTMQNGISYEYDNNDDFKILKSDSCAKTIKVKFDYYTNFNDTYYYELTCSKLIIKKFYAGEDVIFTRK